MRQERAAAAPLLAAKRADPMPNLDALLQGVAGGAVWHAGAASWPQGEAQRRWWASVMLATRGRWQLQTAARELPAPWLTLTANDRTPLAWLWIADGALWMREGDRLWRATVDEAQLREWQEAIARW
jgi:hypothetical protein